ncbi:MAG: hypothetical protein ACXW27_05480 [Allosphingosinicella sp.]
MADRSLAELAETMKDIDSTTLSTRTASGAIAARPMSANRQGWRSGRMPDVGVAVKSSIRAGALALAALVGLAGIGGAPLPSAAPALAASAPQRIGGTWDLAWKNRRGETRRGSMTVEQRGSRLVATVYDRGGATATGSISGPAFTLEGRRLGLPFTVAGRVRGRKMTGALLALGIERRFTGARRGRR